MTQAIPDNLRSGISGDAAGGLPAGLNPEDLVDIYTRMVLARTTDERIWMMNRQGKVPIAASSQGHEAGQLGVLLAAEKDGNCFFFPYYRDLALKMSVGLTPAQVMKSFMGKEGEPYSNARQFPLQGADLERRVIQISNVVAAGMTQAVGFALASKMRRSPGLLDKLPKSSPKGTPFNDGGTVVIVFFGDGASSQGESHEAMNFAGIHRLPVVFVCENNRYAISVPQASQMAISDVAARADGYGFPGVVVDGMDLLAVYQSMSEAIGRARDEGPALVELKLERFMPHTTDDDDRRYRPAEEVEAAKARDPVQSLGELLVAQNYATPERLEAISQEARRAVDEATDAADAAPPPPASTMLDNLFVE